MSFTIGSLFDGSGGFPLAATMCGGTPLWASEVEPYPIAVTKSRFPNMKHLGSVTDVKGDEVDPVDVITFGSPCQDLSVAGKRAGLKHEDNGDEETTRSGLFMEAVRIIKEMRKATNGIYPKFAVWENVPGAFSSNKGEDFRTVCEELIKIVEPGAVMPAVPKNGWPYADVYCGEGWSLAYRVYDAQYWGVPQRRRRIYLVLDLTGECAGKISFEREGLRGYFETGRTPWQGTAPDAEGCAGTDDREGESVTYGFPLGFRPENVNLYEEKATTLCNGTRPGFTTGIICMATQQGGAEIRMDDKAPTVTAAAGMSGNNQPVVCYKDCVLDDQGGQQITVRTDGKTPTIRAEMHRNVPCVMDAIGVDVYNQTLTGDKAKTLNSAASDADHIACVIEQHLFENHSQDTRYKGPLDVCPMLPAQLGTGGNNTPFVVEQRVFRKGTRPHSADEAQKWEDADAANTLNTFDQGEARANELVVETKVYESHPMDSRIKELDGASPTVSAKWHKGAADTPLVCEGTPVYAVDQGGGKSGANFHADLSPTLTCTHGGEPAVAFAMQAFGKYTETEIASAMKARDYKDATDLIVDCAGVDCRNMNESPELYPTLQAKSNGGQSLNYTGAVRIRYIVRRLTPTECARLQGFADRWAVPVSKDDFTDEEYAFWCKVNLDYDTINGKARADENGVIMIWREVKPDKKKGEDFEPYWENTGKPYTHKNKKQMLTWYNKLHTDSSEYKLWGNGIALPTALYVMQGISDVINQ